MAILPRGAHERCQLNLAASKTNEVVTATAVNTRKPAP
jgi:hypothetical protein